MRLKVLQSRFPRHSESAGCVGWAGAEEMISAGDDHQLLRWNLINMEANPIVPLPDTLFPTSMHWYPRSAARTGNTDVFAMTSSDGKLHLINRVGKWEKTVDAHRGAAIMAKWSPDGTGLLSCGEDGAVKMWSRNGMLRSVLAQLNSSVYCMDWDGSSSRIVYCHSENCYIKSLKQQVAPIKWKAHDGVVLCCDWSPVGDLIVTGGEDCKFKVWDAFGRIMFNSSPHDYPITSVSWSPDGELFAVGSYNILRLCDKAGWSHSLEKLTTGSIISIAWSPDGTQLVGGCAGGHVILAHLLEKRVTYRNLEVVQTKWNTVEVRDVSSELAKEKLETRDRVTRISTAYQYLIIVTTAQIYIYSSNNWNTPVIVDLKEKSVTMLIQCEKIFLIADGTMQFIYNYDGRHLCDLKPPGSGTGVLSEETIALSNDTVALRDRGDYRIIHLLDPATGKPQGDGKITHDQEVCEIAVSQSGPINDRMIAYRDNSSNIYVAMVKTYGNTERIAKLGSMAEQLVFNDSVNMLAGVAERRIVIWPMPSIVFNDRSLLQRAVIEKTVGSLGKFPHLLNFTGNSLVIRRSDGSLLPVAISPFPASLLQYARESKWDQAIRMCRHLKDDALWAMLACSAIEAKNLFAAETAYAMLEELETVKLIDEARNHPDKDIKTADYLLISGKINEADTLLERTNHIYRCVMLNIVMSRWGRALAVAVKHKKYLEVVIGHRQRYMEQMGRKEADPNFIKHAAEVEVDWDHIAEITAEEKEKDKR